MDRRFSSVTILLLFSATFHCFPNISYPLKSGTSTPNTLVYNTTTSPLYDITISNPSTTSTFNESSDIGSSTSNKSLLLDVISPTHGSQKTISELKCDEYAEEAASVIETARIFINSTYYVEYNVSNPCKTLVRNPRRIVVGGTIAAPGEFPHMVGLGKYNSDGNFILECGGTLISHSWILSAAHCTHGPNGAPTHARIGIIQLSEKDSGITIPIKTMMRHPDYNPPALYADIALMELNTSVTFSNVIRAACLYQQHDVYSHFPTISGWGTTEIDGDPSNYLLKARLSLVDNLKCAVQHNTTKEVPYGITSSMICAGSDDNKDACHGDSGGPLQISRDACMAQVIGVTSFGRSCAVTNSSGVYIRVSHYIPWIESIVWPQQK